MVYKGPDISTHNGNVDVKRILDAGYNRVDIRTEFRNNKKMHF